MKYYERSIANIARYLSSLAALYAAPHLGMRKNEETQRNNFI
jgi:hypothetical protein